MKRSRRMIRFCTMICLAACLLAGCGRSNRYDLRFTALGYEPRLRDVTEFNDILGCRGRFTEGPVSGDRIRRVYLEDTGNGTYDFLAISYGAPGDKDILRDLDGDGAAELICNARLEEDGSHRIVIFRRRSGVVEAGRVREDFYENADPSTIRETWQRGLFRAAFRPEKGSGEETVRDLTLADFVFAPYRVPEETLKASESRLLELYGAQARDAVAYRELSGLFLADGMLVATYTVEDGNEAITLFFHVLDEPFTGPGLESMGAFSFWSEKEREYGSLCRILAEGDVDRDGLQEWAAELTAWSEGEPVSLYGVFRHRYGLETVCPLPRLDTRVYRSLYQEEEPLFTLGVRQEGEKIAVIARDTFYTAIADGETAGSKIRLYRYLPKNNEWELLGTETFGGEVLTQEYLEEYLLQALAAEE